MSGMDDVDGEDVAPLTPWRVVTAVIRGWWEALWSSLVVGVLTIVVLIMATAILKTVSPEGFADLADGLQFLMTAALADAVRQIPRWGTSADDFVVAYFAGAVALVGGLVGLLVVKPLQVMMTDRYGRPLEHPTRRWVWPLVLLVLLAPARWGAGFTFPDNLDLSAVGLLVVLLSIADAEDSRHFGAKIPGMKEQWRAQMVATARARLEAAERRNSSGGQAPAGGAAEG